MKRLLLIGCVVLTACGDDDEKQNCEVTRIEEGTALAVVTDYQSSKLIAFSSECAGASRDVAVLSGDAVVRKLPGQRAVALNRSLTASNIVLIASDLSVERQIDLPGCGPHDAVLLPSRALFVTCYEDDRARVVNLDDGSLLEVDLSAYADADGIPEMDAVALVDGKLYVTMQLAARPDFMPTGSAIAAVLDAATLALIDTNSVLEGVQGWTLACENPFSPLVVDDGVMYVACASYFPAMSSSVVSLETTGGSNIAVDGETLEGVPTEAFAMDGDDFLVTVAFYNEDFEASSTRLVRIDDGVAETLYEVPGFSLGGVAVADDGLLVSNRTADATGGIYRVDDGAPTRELATDLPPANIVVF